MLGLAELARAVVVADALTVIAKAWSVLPVVFVAVMVKLATPPVPAAGVPLSTPVAALSVRPLGSAPTVTAYVIAAG